MSNNPGSSKKNKNDAQVDLKTFQSLLDKLEASKKRQQRQKSVEGRRDIYAGGLASMMSNFWLVSHLKPETKRHNHRCR